MQDEESRGLVLIIEDESAIRELMAELLELWGFRVLTAANGAEGLAMLQAHPDVAVVLLDLMMPVMDGWEFCGAKQQCRTLAGVPVVVVSGGGDVAAHARQLGATAWLEKPVDAETLIQTVSRYCQPRAA